MYIPIKNLYWRKVVCLLVTVCFTVTGFNIPLAQAQDYRLPVPGVMIHLSPPFDPPILKGIKVHPDDPFRFDFILDKGDSVLSNEQIKEESSKLIKYFLATLTIPENDLWVNLSPYEKDRIIPRSFGLTEMGRDLLAEDYMLKQITASMIYPEDEIGKEFWKRIYAEAAKKYGTTNIPVNTFNKVWIVPDKAVVFENAKAGTAYVVESKLKVMLEQDYLALSHSVIPVSSIVIPAKAGIQNKNDINAVKTSPLALRNDINSIGANIVREIVIPQLNKEVNEGKNFSHLRQVYNSLILAAWYKKKIKDSILEQVYGDKRKVAGVNIDDPKEIQKIYQRYLRAFKKGVFNYIKEETDTLSQESIPRKYFSGGAVFGKYMDKAMVIITSLPAVQEDLSVDQNDLDITANINRTGGAAERTDMEAIGKLTPIIPSPRSINKNNTLIDTNTSPVPQNNISLSSQVHQMITRIQDTNSAENNGDRGASRAEFLEYNLRHIQQRFKVLDATDPLFVQTDQIFNDAIKLLKAKGKIPEARNYQLVLYDSNSLDAYYVVGSNSVFMSTGLLYELDRYLKLKGKPGIGLDHIAVILDHELPHSVQNFDSLGQRWSEKKGDSRKKEYDADTESMFLTDALGFNPNAALDIMNFFIYAEGDPTLKMRLKRILGTHPQSIDRRNRLESIIQDKNVLLMNTGRPYQYISLSYEDHLIKRLAQINSASDLEGFSGDIHEIVSMLAVIRHTDFIDLVGSKYGIKDNLKYILDDPKLIEVLHQYIKNRYGNKFSQTQQDLLFQIHFGFLFNDNLERGKLQDALFMTAQQSVINGILDQLTTQEISDVYSTITANPPIYSSDLPVQVERDTEYESRYFNRVRQSFLMNLNLANRLMMEKLDHRTELIGIRELMKAMHYFYGRELTDIGEFDNYWRGVMAILEAQMTDKNSIKSIIDEVKKVFQDQPTVQGSFYKKFIVYLIQENSNFRNLSFSDQMGLINSLFPDHSGLKNQVLRVFWDENNFKLDFLSPEEARDILIKLIENVDLSNGERDHNLFYDDTGTEIYYIGENGITAVDQEKSLYGEMARKLSEIIKRSQKQGQSLQEIYNLLDHNVLMDYQDLMRLYGTLLEQADAETYLLIAGKIKKFIERNGLAITEDKDVTETQWRAADYHDAFILAYFYKTQGIPFTFYQIVDSKHAYAEEWSEEKPFRKKVESYKQYEKIPLLLEITDVQSGQKIIFRSGHEALSKSSGAYFRRAWHFYFNNVFKEVLGKTGFKPTVNDLTVLRDHFLDRQDLNDWMALFYQYAELKDGEILQIINYLKRPESGDNNPVATGSRENNPIDLVNAFRSIEIKGGRSVDSVGEQRALAKGFQLWGNRNYNLATIEDLQRVLDELDIYFPYDSRLKRMEIEKIFIAMISHITGLPYSKQSVYFRYKIDGTLENILYEGYSLDQNSKDFAPSEEQAVRLLQGFEKIYPDLSNDRKLSFGKLLYRMFRNNRNLSSFKNIAAQMELIEILFPFYSKAKDDFIFEALDEQDVSDSDYQNAVKLTTPFALQDEDRGVNRTVWGLEMLKEAMRDESRAERRKTILWLITGDDKYKPSKIVDIEIHNNANANGLIDAFWFMTDSEREDFLSEVLKGKNGLFEIQYEVNGLQEKITHENTRAQIEDAIEKRFNAADNFKRLKHRSNILYLAESRQVLFGISKPWDAKSIDSRAKQLAEDFPFLGQGMVDDLNTRIEERNQTLSDLRNEAVEIIKDTIIPLFNESGIVFIYESKNFQNRMLSSIINLLENEGLTQQDLKEKILEAFISAIESETTAHVGTYLHRMKEGLEIKPEQTQLVNRLMPVLQTLTEKTAVRLSSLIQSSQQFSDAHVSEEVSNTYFQQAQQRAETEVEETFSSFSSPNPSYLRLSRLLRVYGITSDYKLELEEYAEFEEFIDDLIDGQLKGIFDGEAYQTLKGLIEIKFKYHSLDRRVQFLNGLLPALHGKKNKGDVIVALAEQSGIPVLKFLQILSQRKAFVKLEKDPVEGERLNARIGSVKSDVDPIRKATIFQILAQMGLLGIVKYLGKRYGSGSIGQVNKLVLRQPIIVDDIEYTEVAAKTIRPSALKHLDEDFYVLGRQVSFFNLRHPQLAISNNTLDQSRTAINEEKDFPRETKAQETIRANMIRRGSKLKVPLVFSIGRPGSETLVILQEFIKGTLLNDVDDDQDTHRSYRILDEFFKQVFVDGIYHADLHDGNIMVGKDGKVTFLDLGGYGKVPPGKKKSLYRLIESIAMGNPSNLIAVLKEFGVSVDPIMNDKIQSAFKGLNNNEERFENIFLILNDDKSGIPNSLFMFFQALSKVGKYFDDIGLRRLILFGKYKLLVSIRRETEWDKAMKTDEINPSEEQIQKRMLRLAAGAVAGATSEASGDEQGINALGYKAGLEFSHEGVLTLQRIIREAVEYVAANYSHLNDEEKSAQVYNRIWNIANGYVKFRIKDRRQGSQAGIEEVMVMEWLKDIPAIERYFSWQKTNVPDVSDNSLTIKEGPGGIDLTPANMNLQTKVMDSSEQLRVSVNTTFRGNDNGIKFHLDAAMLQQLQNAPGFVPVIINVRPLGNLRRFLGLRNEPVTS